MLKACVKKQTYRSLNSTILIPSDVSLEMCHLIKIFENAILKFSSWDANQFMGKFCSS